jgi:phospholipase C
MDRRSFLRLAAGMGGAAALGPALAPTLLPSLGRLGGLSAAPANSILDGAAADSPIDTVVVLMMENRSVDHYMGWLAADATYLENGRRRYGDTFAYDGLQRTSYLDPATALPAETYDIVSQHGADNAYRGCGFGDPGHGWSAGRAQRDGGFLAPGSGNDHFALSYYNPDSLPMHSLLARNFTTFDRYHCSVLGPTYPNREYMHSAQSGGIKSNDLPPQIGYPTGFDWPTIWDKLMAAGVSCGYYFVDLPVVALWGPRLAPVAHPIEHYFADAAAGTLPKVVFLDPGFTTGFRTDDHPHADIRAGQKYLLDVFKAFHSSPQWAKGAFFVTYDEWGGFFDHVAPPLLADDRASANDANNFGQAGFRVPTMMASPYAQPGYVDHRLYDHTSILRFIEWRYLGAPAEGPGAVGDSWFLTSRDRNAANIGRSLTTSPVSYEVDMPILPEVPIASQSCEGDETKVTIAPVVGRPVEQPVGHPVDDFAKFLESGFAEAMGYKVDPRVPAA